MHRVIRIAHVCVCMYKLTTIGFARSTFAREQMLWHLRTNESIGLAFQA